MLNLVFTHSITIIPMVWFKKFVMSKIALRLEEKHHSMAHYGGKRRSVFLELKMAMFGEKNAFTDD